MRTLVNLTPTMATFARGPDTTHFLYRLTCTAEKAAHSHSTRTSLTPCKLRTRQCKCRRLIIKHNFHLQNAKKSTCWPPALGNQGHANGGSSHYACISHAQAMLVNTAGGLGFWWDGSLHICSSSRLLKRRTHC